MDPLIDYPGTSKAIDGHLKTRSFGYKTVFTETHLALYSIICGKAFVNWSSFLSMLHANVLAPKSIVSSFQGDVRPSGFDCRDVEL